MVYETYSKRQKRLRGEKLDFYVYDAFPKEFKVQVVYLWNLALGREEEYGNVGEAYKMIAGTLREEYGRFELVNGGSRMSDAKDLRAFLFQEEDPEKILDILELSFRVINVRGRDWNYRHLREADEIADRAIENLNIRFKEHGLGFQFSNHEIIRIDSELIHTEVVKPVLRLLNQPYFKGAEDEYLAAHEHYRHGNTKEALVECLKSFESAMMGICDKRGWAYEPKATAKALIGICFANHLIPSFWESEMTGLRALLEGGVPTGRNKLAGHGQGAEPISVPPHIASYIMHMTAANLKFLVEADAALG
jgi:hypothetical protein